MGGWDGGGGDDGFLRYGGEKTTLCGGCYEVLESLLELLRGWKLGQVRGTETACDYLPEMPDCMSASVVKIWFDTGALLFPNGTSWVGQKLSFERLHRCLR